MKKFLLLLLSLVAYMPLGAQTNRYAAALIPDSLKKGSNAIVRNSSMEYIYKSPVSSTEKLSEAITVLNENGEADAYIQIHTDMFSTLKCFSGRIIDASGNIIRKISKSELSFTDYFTGLASDHRMWYYVPQAAKYPYTVSYEYEIVHSDGILAFPTFSPIPGFDVAVEQASYQLTVPTGTDFHAKNRNTDIAPTKETQGNKDVYTWQVSILPAIEAVPFMPRFEDRMPIVFLTPHDFTYYGKSGTMDTWAGYSQWQWELLKGRDVLPEEFKAKIRELTADAANDREKVAILYKLLGETRYVLIAVGVSGFQPMAAADVYKNNFGDCKGLSNYMKAMLAACDVESFYTEIGMGDRKLHDDYTHPAQTNHAILYVPLDGEELWVECTDPTLPLGYVHSGISDRYALVYRDNTAVLVKTPSYADSANRSVLTAEIHLNSEGNINAQVKTRNKMAQYENAMGFEKQSPEDQLKFVSRTVNLPLVNITDINYTEEKSAEPWNEISYQLNGRITLSGTRAYIPVNPLRDNYAPKLRRTRTSDIYISNGYCKKDSISLVIPEEYTIEALPRPVAVETPFGHLEMLALPTDDGAIIFRRLQLNKGTYSLDDYAEFKSFMEKVDDCNKAKIVLLKKE